MIAAPKPEIQPKSRKTLPTDAIIAAMRRADALAAANTHGGPFGSVVLGPDGEVMGEGRNEVVHFTNPTCHAEMQAIRDAGKRHGRWHLKGATLVTSCECCPMCLAAAYAAGIEHIVFGNTRKDAADIGFADDAIYEEMKVGFDKLDIEMVRSSIYLRPGIDAAIADADGNILAEASLADADPSDPTGIPSVMVVAKACQSLKSFHLPEGAVLVTRQTIHALGFTAARWAHIQTIQCLRDTGFEGGERIHHPALVYDDIALPVASFRNRKIPIERLENPTVLEETLKTFSKWFNDQNKVLY